MHTGGMNCARGYRTSLKPSLHRRWFAQPVAYGMLTSSLYSRLVGMYLPGRYCLLHGIDIDFVSPAFAGDKLSVSGRITYLNQAYRRAEIRAAIHNGRGELISKAKIRIGVHEH